MEMSGHLHALVTLRQGKSPWYPLDKSRYNSWKFSFLAVYFRAERPHLKGNVEGKVVSVFN